MVFVFYLQIYVFNIYAYRDVDPSGAGDTNATRSMTQVKAMLIKQQRSLCCVTRCYCCDLLYTANLHRNRGVKKVSCLALAKLTFLLSL